MNKKQQQKLEHKRSYGWTAGDSLVAAPLLALVLWALLCMAEACLCGVSLLSTLLLYPLLLVSVIIIIKGLIRTLTTERSSISVTVWMRRLLMLIIIVVSVWDLFSRTVVGGRWEDLGFRFQIQSSTDLDKVQAWATDFLEKHKSDITLGRPLEIDVQSPLVPDYVRRIAGTRGLTAYGTDPQNRCVIITYGGGFGHWGIQIGAKTYRNEVGDGIYRWRDGIYGFRGQ